LGSLQRLDHLLQVSWLCSICLATGFLNKLLLPVQQVKLLVEVAEVLFDGLFLKIQLVWIFIDQMLVLIELSLVIVQ